MLVVLLAFLGGMLTILSPCILPVLPFVFARGDRPFVTSTLPLLAGMTLTFALVATLAAVGGAWAVHVNQYGRILALVVLFLFALTLISRRLATALAAPFVSLGNRLLQPGQAGSGSGVLRSVGLGIATGLLWAPCAGPILGLVLTGAAVSGPNPRTTLLLLAYAAGAATSLAVATLAGGRVFARLKQGLGAGEWVRRGLGVAVLAGVAAIALGWDTGLLTRISLASTGRLEQALLGKVGAGNGTPSVSSSSEPSMLASASATRMLPVEGRMPSLDGAQLWLNSPPLTTAGLRGKVVVVDFWTYSCINCLRSIPYVRAWYEKYKDHGLVIVGVHSPEFAFERDSGNVRRAVKDLGITYPVALDNSFTIWRAFNNQYWPAHYFVDAKGQIRAHHFGEGEYDEGEQIIRQLLTEAGYQLPGDGASAPVPVKPVEMPGDGGSLRSMETYIGSARADRFVSKGGIVPDRTTMYVAPASLGLNQWALSGDWNVKPEEAQLVGPSGSIAYRFRARDVHLVLGPGADRKPVRFRILIDGAAPGASHGADVDGDGHGVVREERLYQLVRQAGEVVERTFTIEFLEAGVRAYAFTFG